MNLLLLVFLTFCPSTVYDTTVDNAAAHHELDPCLVRSVLWTESYGDPEAESHAGAQGLMQITPDTRDFIEAICGYPTQRIKDEPVVNIWAGTCYLRWLVDFFDGRVEWALAGYNAGPGTVQKYNGIPPWPETERYVEKVMYGMEPMGEANVMDSDGGDYVLGGGYRGYDGGVCAAIR